MFKDSTVFGPGESTDHSTNSIYGCGQHIMIFIFVYFLMHEMADHRKNEIEHGSDGKLLGRRQCRQIEDCSDTSVHL